MNWACHGEVLRLRTGGGFERDPLDGEGQHSEQRRQVRRVKRRLGGESGCETAEVTGGAVQFGCGWRF